MLLDKLKMEFISTFILLFLTGIATVNVFVEAHDLLTMCVLFFIIYCIITWVAFPISLAQFNPIITISLMISGHIGYLNAVLYFITHFIAAIFAGSLIKTCIPSEFNQDLSDTILGIPFIETNILKAIFYEIIAGFLLVFVYYVLVLEKTTPNYLSGPAMGAVMFVLNLSLFKKTGAGINPAKMLGFAIISNNYNDLYVYIIGPYVGGVFGGLLGMFLLTEKSAAYKVRLQQEKLNNKKMLKKLKNNQVLESE
jgi:glycerol uptake facilitator-like aquaporin